MLDLCGDSLAALLLKQRLSGERTLGQLFPHGSMIPCHIRCDGLVDGVPGLNRTVSTRVRSELCPTSGTASRDSDEQLVANMW